MAPRPERLTIRAWARRCRVQAQGEGPSAPPPDSEPLTLEEAMLATLIDSHDRLVQIEAQVVEMAGRLQRLETEGAPRLWGGLGQIAAFCDVLRGMLARQVEPENGLVRQP